MNDLNIRPRPISTKVNRISDGVPDKALGDGKNISAWSSQRRGKPIDISLVLHSTDFPFFIVSCFMLQMACNFPRSKNQTCQKAFQKLLQEFFRSQWNLGGAEKKVT